jgi:glycosyltransferase involved in cell wall biosynthesis
MNKKTKVLFIHLYNNFTGSTNILFNIIGNINDRFECYLVTDKGAEGFLSKLAINYDCYDKTMVSNRLFKWLIHQSKLFFKVLKHRDCDVIYCNTMYSVGAGIAGYLCRKKVIYHIHEVSVTPKLLKYLLIFVINKTATKNIVVSDFLKKEIYWLKNTQIIYNAVGNAFFNNLLPKTSTDKFTILMLSSLQKGKGIEMFIKLADELPQCHFELVVSVSEDVLQDYLHKKNLSTNLHVFSVQKNVHPFYNRAKLLLNLSNPDICIETFGMTILEAMHYSIPAIVPNVGGPMDLIEDGVNGYCIDVRNKAELIAHITKIATDENLYNRLSLNALTKASNYNIATMIESVESILEN